MSKFSYSTNWMGPISAKWYTDRGFDPKEDSYSCGRIDIYGPTESPYGDEISVPVMKSEDWHMLGNWLDDFKTDTQYDLNMLLQEYYAAGYPEIRWVT